MRLTEDNVPAWKQEFKRVLIEKVKFHVVEPLDPAVLEDTEVSIVADTVGKSLAVRLEKTMMADKREEHANAFIPKDWWNHLLGSVVGPFLYRLTRGKWAIEPKMVSIPTMTTVYNLCPHIASRKQSDHVEFLVHKDAVSE